MYKYNHQNIKLEHHQKHMKPKAMCFHGRMAMH